jgi:hypothetical protein
MASTDSTITEVRLVRRKYRWPAQQLNFWLFIMLVAGSTVLGIFASFISVQDQLMLGTPWYALPSCPLHSHLPLRIHSWHLPLEMHGGNRNTD